MPLFRGWTDYLRLPWAHLEWNLRKSLWQRRGRSGPCPCLNPSDPHGPARARCDAIIHWHQPARFQRVCPLLVKAEGEWRCAGGRDGVRPYWTRALRFHGALLCGLGLAALLSLHGLLYLGGARDIGPLDFATPSGWSRIQTARADAFRRQALQAFADGRYPEMMLALSTAEDLSPHGDLDTRLLLLRLAEQRRHFDLADRLHANLQNQHPDALAAIDIVRHDSLLLSGRWPALARLALTRLEPGRPDSGPWLRTLALTVRHIADRADFPRLHATEISRLPPDWIQLIRYLCADDPAGLDFVNVTADSTLHATIALEHATRIGDAVTAAAAIGQLASRPEPFRDLRHQTLVRLRFQSPLRSHAPLRAELVDLAATSPARLQRLLADALLTGDAEWLDIIARRLPDALPASLAGDLWFAAALLDRPALRVRAETRLTATGRVAPDYFELAARREPGAADWMQWLTLVPCSRDMLLALAERGHGSALR